MWALNLLSKTLEHPVIGKLISVLKFLKLRKNYWTITALVTLFTIREAVAWKYSEFLKDQAQNNPDYNTLYTIADFIFAGGSWQLMVLGILLILLFSFIYYIELNSKHPKESLEKAIDNTSTNNYLIKQLNKQEEKIKALKDDLKKSLSGAERFRLSSKINHLTKEKKSYQSKITELESRLQEIGAEVDAVKEVGYIVHTEGADQAIEYLEKLNFDNDRKKNIENAKTLLIQADLYNIKNEYEKANKAYLQSIEFDRSFLNTFAYLSFLKQQNRFDDAIKQLQIAQLDLELIRDQKALVCAELADLLGKYSRFSEAKDLFVESLDIYGALRKSNPGIYESNIAAILVKLGKLYHMSKKYPNAEKFYIEALTLYDDLAKLGRNKYQLHISAVYANLVSVYRDMGKLDQAEELSIKALNIQKEIAKSQPSNYNESHIAVILNNLATVHEAKGKLKKAEELYLESLAIKRRLAKINPEAFIGDIASTLTSLSKTYVKEEELTEAQESITEALDIYRELVKIDSRAYRDALAKALNGLGDIYRQYGKTKEAEDSLCEALTIFRELEKENPSVYSPEVAFMLHNIALVYKEQEHLDKADEYFKEALKYFKELEKENSSLYKPEMANLFKNLLILHVSQNRMLEASSYYSEALNAYKELIKVDLSVHGVNYAQTIMIGVDSLCQSAKNLNEAKAILEQLKDVPRVKGLLDFIEKKYGL